MVLFNFRAYVLKQQLRYLFFKQAGEIMSLSVAEIKNKLRDKIVKGRDSLSVTEQYEKSKEVERLFFSLPDLISGQVFFIYAHFRSEVQTDRIINHLLLMGKTVCTPYVLKNEKSMIAVEIKNPYSELAPGYLNIPEPKQELITSRNIQAKMIDIALFPGVAFDLSGGRLGYGGGFYDRFFKGNDIHAKKIGLSYSIQIVENIPREEHDVKTDMVISEKGITQCNSN